MTDFSLMNIDSKLENIAKPPNPVLSVSLSNSSRMQIWFNIKNKLMLFIQLTEEKKV